MKLIPHMAKAGLFSQINFVITHISKNGSAKFYVDWSEGTPYDQPDQTNVFDTLFVQDTTDQHSSHVVKNWPHRRYTGRNVDQLYLGDSAWRWDLFWSWQQLTIQENITREVEKICKSWNEPVTALHIRNLKIGNECPDRKAPQLADYEAVLSQHSGLIYLATDNTEAVSKFKDLLGNRLIYRDIDRSPNMQTEFHHTSSQTLQDVENCLIDVLVMSRCKHLIHSVSNVATAVLSLNPEMSHTYLRRQEAILLQSSKRSKRHATIKNTIKFCQAKTLIHFKCNDWSDWILIYPNMVLKRLSNAGTATFQRSSKGNLQVIWKNGSIQEFTPILFNQDRRFSVQESIYYIITSP